jgi:hypothetical protein
MLPGFPPGSSTKPISLLQSALRPIIGSRGPSDLLQAKRHRTGPNGFPPLKAPVNHWAELFLHVVQVVKILAEIAWRKTFDLSFLFFSELILS